LSDLELQREDDLIYAEVGDLVRETARDAEPIKGANALEDQLLGGLNVALSALVQVL